MLRAKGYFSTRFSTPILMLHPRAHGDMLREKIARLRVQC
jgi:ATP-dependent phosphoenolpyruvate carboxykinase